MRRLSTVFLICFLAVFAGLGGAITWKALGRRAAPPPAPAAQQADYQIKEVHINETLEGDLRWTLDADQADVFDKDQRTQMRKVTIRVFSKDGVWTVTGDQGTLDNEKRDVSIEGNVVVTAGDGLTMKTKELRWHNQDRNLFTDTPVEIERAGFRIVGRGLDVRMQEERAVVEGKVRVVITDRANASLSLFPRSGS